MKDNISKWALRHSEKRKPSVAEREWKLPLHREGKLMGLKNHRLLHGGEGKQKQGVRIFEEEEVL